MLVCLDIFDQLVGFYQHNSEPIQARGIIVTYKLEFFCFLQVITAFQNVNLSADTRKEMEEWISALKSVGSKSSSVSSY